MNIDFTKNEDNTARIEVTVEPQDYKDQLEQELKTYQKKSNMKGFRKGKTPRSLIRKMYGQALLTDIVTKKLQESLNEYLENEKLKIMGQPIPAEDQVIHNFKVGEDISYNFKFEIGLKPEFEPGGLNESYHYYDIQISDDEIDKQIDILRRRNGSHKEVEKEFEEDDIISFNAWELENGDIKKDGLETTFDVTVDMMADDFKELVLSKEVGDTLDFDIYQVEKNLLEERVRKHLMNLDEEEADRDVNKEFRAEIVKASRLVLADIDEEFLQKAFGEDLTTEEEARKLIMEDLKEYYDDQADSLLFQEVHERLMERTEIDLPDEFMKKWMLYRENSEDTDPVTFDVIEEKYDQEFKKSLRWHLISDMLLEKYDVRVEEEEIVEELGKRIQQYLPGQQLNQQVYNQILQSLAQDEKQVQDANSKVSTHKMFVALKPDLDLDMEEISQEAFEEKLNQIRDDHQRKMKGQSAENGKAIAGKEE